MVAMKKFFFGLAIGTAALVSIVSGQAQVSSGLLLGYKEGSSYKTLWIAPQNGKLVAKQGQDILVPRKSGWWRVGSSSATAKGLDQEISTKQYLFAQATALGSRGTKPDFEPDCTEQSQDSLLWVHEQYLALEQNAGGYCKGAAHPWSAGTLQVRDLDFIQRSGNSLNFDLQLKHFKDLVELIDDRAEDKLIQSGEAFYKALPADKQDFYEKSPSPVNWGLIRRDGQWVLRGRLGYSYEAVRSVCCIDFDSGITLPSGLVGHDRLAISYAVLKKGNPKIIDAFSSPKNDILYTLEKTQLTAYGLQNGKLGAVIFRLGFKNQVAPVMIEWANAGSVARWTQDLQKLLK